MAQKVDQDAQGILVSIKGAVEAGNPGRLREIGTSTGINAAAKSLFLGESQEAERLAAEVLPLVKAASDGNDFYAGCTLGEVYLLQRDLKSAAVQYQKVIDKHSSRTGDLAGTRQQATRICSALQLSKEETKEVLAPFELLDQ